MIDVPMIGLHGKKESGKDFVFDRIRALGGPRYHRLSVADPLKDSVAALFGITTEQLDAWKNDRTAEVALFAGGDEQVSMSVRRFLERYGHQAHREVFGEDFWLDFWLTLVKRQRRLSKPAPTIVNTSVRYANEAEAIQAAGGVVWRIVGPPEVEDAPDQVDEHGKPIPSELVLPPHLIDATIDNTIRDGNPAYVDDQVALLLAGGSLS